MSEYLSLDAIRERTHSRFTLLAEREVTSTNAVLKTMADRGAPAGLVLFADSQTAGRGSRGRSFFSPQGGLYFSLLLRPESEAVAALSVTTAAAVAVCRALDEFTEQPLAIKWVNDIYCRDRKIAGILTEGVLGDKGFRYQILGIGINLAPPDGGFPSEIRDRAGALLTKAAPDGFKDTVAARLLDELDDLLFTADRVAVLDEYRRRSWLQGKTVDVTQGNISYRARVTGIGEDFALLLTKESGEEVALRSGEATIAQK